MVTRAGIVKNMMDLAIAPDNEGCTLYCGSGYAIGFAQLHYAVKLADLCFRIGQQTDREPVFIAEIGMVEAIVQTHARNLGARFLEFRVEIGISDRETQTGWHAVTGIEAEHHRALSKLRTQVEHFHVRVRQHECRCVTSDRNTGCSATRQGFYPTRSDRVMAGQTGQF